MGRPSVATFLSFGADSESLSGAMAQNTIAIVCDCDDTLAPDTTVQLLSEFGVDGTEFFGTVVEPLVKEG